MISTHCRVERLSRVATADRIIARLRAVNAEMRAAIKAYLGWAHPTICTEPDLRQIRERLRAAFEAAEEDDSP
jgi:hypothetical protein